jgi:ribosome-binding factor A
METKRQLKISRLLQKDLGEIFQTESRGLFHGNMITVTKVYVTNDLSLARAYLSLFGPEDKQVLFGKINQHRKEIRHQLALRVKNQIRAIPELEFFIDDSLDYIDNIEKLLKSE